MCSGPYGERANCTMHDVKRGGMRRAHRCFRLGNFAVTKGCDMWEEAPLYSLVIGVILNPNRYCFSALPNVYVFDSYLTKNSSIKVDRRPCLIRLGSERAKIRSITALSPRALLPLRGSTMVRVFRLRPARLLALRDFPLDGKFRIVLSTRAEPFLGMIWVTRLITI